MKVLFILFFIFFVNGFCHPQENLEAEVIQANDPRVACFMQKQRGICRAKFIRYYYNADQNECMEFEYGGCNGNANNFKTKGECEYKCKK